MRRRSLGVVIVLLVPVACQPDAPALHLGEVEVVLAEGSGEPNLHATSDGRVILTWFQQAGDGASLHVAERESGVWTEARTIVAGESFFVNWADFPSLIELSDGRWLAHWPERVAEATYAYHVKLATSVDRGATWSEPFVPHRDDSPTEHGFVSMVPLDSGAAAMIWLDGRKMAGDIGGEGGGGSGAHGELEVGEMSLRATLLAGDGRLGPDVLLDGRACECCQTALVRTGRGLVAAYRDRSEEELRNIAAVRWVDGVWSEPATVADDGWVYPGCPVNGPQLAARGDTVVVAWFTAPDEKPQVKVAFSSDAGASFGPPIRADDGDPLGRVDVEILEDGRAVVSWLERSSAGPETGAGAEVRLRTIELEGRLGPGLTVGRTSASRASGFPRIARAGRVLVVAWAAVGDENGVRVRTITIE